NDAVSGVKEEFTAIGESIGRQFRAFISPETSNSGEGGSPSSRTFEEFDMSEAQYEHASTVEQLVPSLAELKSQISSDKSEKQFWMIYFILLHPRLNDEDLELLSTPEARFTCVFLIFSQSNTIVEARETLLTMLQAKKSKDINSENPQLGSSDNEGDTPMNNSQSAEDVTSSENSNASESVKGTESDKDKKILEAEDGSSFTFNDRNESDAKPDKWEEKGKSVTTGTSAAAPKQFQSEDDVSFSDLEDDDNDLPNRISSSEPSQSKGTSSPEGSNEWVRLNKNVEARGSEVKGHSSLRDRDSEGEDSTGWLTVDDFDP
uniref:BSD domain-containing protein n=1 Tax=Chenopodium quinoa TaxID=63459 RepID=A0A803LH55_CHEQI